MKQIKLFISMLMLMCFSIGNVWATDFSYTFTNTPAAGNNTWNGVVWTVALDGGIASSFVTGQGAHYGTNNNSCNSVTISTSAISGTISSISVQASRGSSLVGNLSVSVGGTDYTLTSGDAALTTSNATYTFTGSSSGEIEILWTKSSGKGAFYILQIDITYTTGGGGSTAGTITANPVSVNDLENSGSIAVSYTGITDVAQVDDIAIYNDETHLSAFTDNWLAADWNNDKSAIDYVIDAQPVNGTARTAYIYVYALDDEGNDVEKVIEVSQAAYVAPLTTIQDIFNAASTTAADKKITFDASWVISGVSSNGKTAYITDGTKGFVLYNSAASIGLAAGKTLSGTVYRSLKTYNGAAQLQNFTTDGLTIENSNGSLALSNVAVSELSGVNTGSLIKLEGYRYDGTNLSDGTNTVQPYTTLLSPLGLVNGKKYDVTGVYLQFNSTKEILPRNAADIEEVNESFTITAESNNTSYGTVSLSGNVITGTPAQGYRYASPAYTVSPANSATVAQNGNEFTVTATANTTVTINFEAIPTHNIIFNTNGVATIANAVVAEGATYNITETPAAGLSPSCTYNTFAGWTTATTIADASVKPTTVSSVTMDNADVTLNAVYSQSSGGGGDVNGTKTFTFSDIATAKGWENSVAYTEVEDSPVTIEAQGGGNNGKWYTSGSGSWRMYSGGTVSITVDGGVVTSVTSSPSCDFTITNGVASFSPSARTDFTEISVNYTISGSGTTTYSLDAECAAPGQCVAPTFSPAAGTYNATQNVELSTTTEGATIYYTTNGNDPTTASSVYSTAIPVTETTTIKAIAVKSGMDNSSVASATYTLKCATPTISGKTTFGSTTTVTLTCETANATIYYTTNGNEPTSSSTAYSAPFTLDATSTVKAIAIKANWSDSEIAEQEFVQQHEYTSNYDLTAIEGFSEWGNSYNEHIISNNLTSIILSLASRQTGTITNMPVTKGNPVEVKLVNETYKILAVKFVCSQWGSKAQTITLKYSTDGGSNYSDFDPVLTSDNFVIEQLNMPNGVNAVQISFSSTSNQVGIQSVHLDVVNASNEPVTSVVNINDNVTARKYINNGVLYIEREGKIYNVMGVQVR